MAASKMLMSIDTDYYDAIIAVEQRTSAASCCKMLNHDALEFICTVAQGNNQPGPKLPPKPANATPSQVCMPELSMPMVSASCRRGSTAVTYYMAAHLQLNGVSILQEEMHSTWLLPVNMSVQLSTAASYEHAGMHPEPSTLQANGSRQACTVRHHAARHLLHSNPRAHAGLHMLSNTKQACTCCQIPCSLVVVLRCWLARLHAFSALHSERRCCAHCAPTPQSHRHNG